MAVTVSAPHPRHLLIEGSRDAIEHRAVNDPQRYGSADAAEEWNR